MTQVTELGDMDGPAFLTWLDGKSGVYFISNEYHHSQRFLVKVGTAHGTIQAWRSTTRRGGLRTRLEQYLLCYPRGYSIYGLILTDANLASKTESQIQSYLAGKKRKANFPHSRTEEWFWLSQEEIETVVKLFGDPSSSPLSVNQYYVFSPYYFLTKNPTAGRQRKVKTMSTPQRRRHESTSSASPIRTGKTVRKRRRFERDGDIPKLSLEDA